MVDAKLIGLVFFALAASSAVADAKSPVTVADEPARAIVVLHGLARSPRMMNPLVTALETAGFSKVCNIGYPSMSHEIQTLAEDYVMPAVAECADGAERIDFVTHSLGGLIVRQLSRSQVTPAIGRVVMLGTPNGGSEIADCVLLRRFIGRSGRQLGPRRSDYLASLGPSDFEVGVIAGERKGPHLFARRLPGADDGRVSVCSANLAGSSGFIVVPVKHGRFMRDDESVEETVRFLRTGAFSSDRRERTDALLARCADTADAAAGSNASAQQTLHDPAELALLDGLL